MHEHLALPRRIDMHMHTLHSFDGEQSVDEACRAALDAGLAEICLTEHIEPGHPDTACDIPPVWDILLEEVSQLRRAYPGLQLHVGVEIGDNPACRAQVQRMLDTVPLDFRLLSLHLVNGVDCYDADRYYTGKTRRQAITEYAEAILESVRAWEDFDSVAHIGYVSRYAPWTEDHALHHEDAPEVFDAIFRRIIELDKCLEINTSSFAAKGVLFPDAGLIRRYIELGGECFTFGSDAHRAGDVGRSIEEAKALVRSLGGKYQASFSQRKRTLYAL